MTLSELIKHVGDDNVQVQMLAECLISVSNGKHHSRVTFGTDTGKGHALANSVAANTPPKFVGMILWLPKEKMPQS